MINFRIGQVRDDLSKRNFVKFLKISVRPEKHHRGKFFMSKNVFAYFHELKDVDSRNEKKIREKKFGRGDLVKIERVDFRVKKLSFSFFCL